MEDRFERKRSSGIEVTIFLKKARLFPKSALAQT